MRYIKYLFIISLFIFLMPNVYASSIEVTAKANNTNVSTGQEVIINVNLKADEIIAECLFNFETDNGINYISSNALDGWSLINGEKGTLLSNNNVSSNMLMTGKNILELKYKVNNAGKVVIKTIECVSMKENVYDSEEDIVINFSIKENDVTLKPPSSNENDDFPGTEGEVNKTGKLKNIILSEGNIDFREDVYEYNVIVKDFKRLEVSLDMDGIVTYTMNKEIVDNNNRVVIAVLGDNGDTTNYIINVTEINDAEEEQIGSLDEEKKTNFVPMFLGIIGLLVLLNIYRIIKKIKK